MRYPDVIKATFLSRPNRFVAQVEVEGRVTVAHVKNTGRCRELLVPGAAVFLQQHHNPSRKTPFSLIAVQKGELLINMDSQAPNQVWDEALADGLYIPELGVADTIHREVTWGHSRLDFLVECGKRSAYMEVKGVTLEENRVVRFPDAPTERGVKHLHTLMEINQSGGMAYVVFIVQMEGAQYFTPNADMHPAFAQTLREASEQGVKILAYECHVEPDGLKVTKPVPIRLLEKNNI
ncbi:DNA/RNA nuclease SfsA [[Clostridium] leptum]|nr:DNA/RNA nuclease SfsA [[Clostridium] leptum]